MSAKKGKKKWMIIVAIVLVLALIIGVVVVGAGQKQEQEVGGSIELVTKRTIANSISANGSVEAANKENVTGGSYGMKVETLNVKEGDIVAAGDVLCVFNTDDVDEQIKTTEENIANAKNDKSEQVADYDEQIAEQKASNEADLTEAKEKLAEAETKLAQEKEELAKWEKKYADGKAEGTITVSEEIDLVSTINTQKSTVDSAQSRVDTCKSRVDSLEDADTSSLEDAKENYIEQINDTIDGYEERLESLQEQKAEATIYAGISGVVTAVNVTAGANFNGGTIASIESIDKFVVEAQVEEYDFL